MVKNQSDGCPKGLVRKKYMVELLCSRVADKKNETYEGRGGKSIMKVVGGHEGI